MKLSVSSNPRKFKSTNFKVKNQKFKFKSQKSFSFLWEDLEKVRGPVLVPRRHQFLKRNLSVKRVVLPNIQTASSSTKKFSLVCSWIYDGHSVIPKLLEMFKFLKLSCTCISLIATHFPLFFAISRTVRITHAIMKLVWKSLSFRLPVHELL